jgi:hypothetical protein
MVPPQVPRRRTVRQAILHHQPNGGVDHPVGVVALGQGHVIHVGVEVRVALRAAMLGVREVNLARASGDRVSKIVELPRDGAEAVGIAAALGTRATPVVAASLDHLGRRQILNPRDPFRDIRHILAWASHDELLPKFVLGKSSANAGQDPQENSVTMLQSPDQLLFAGPCAL